MRNKPYVAVAAVPGALMLWWAVSLWWNENGIMAVVVGAVAAALFVAAYRIAKAASFAPSKNSKWDSTRSPDVSRWVAAQDEKDEHPAARS